MANSQFTLKRSRIKLICTILLAGFSLSLLVNFVIGNLSNTGYPFNTFFFRPGAIFVDFHMPYIIASDPFAELRGVSPVSNKIFAMPEIISAEFWNKNSSGPLYFPFAYWIALPFRLLPEISGLGLFWILTICFFYYVCQRHIRNTAGWFQTLVICICSYPFLILLSRSNFDAFIFVFLYIFIFFYDRKPTFSAIALACAVAMKFLPIGYILLQCTEKKYKEIFITLAGAFFLNVAAYALYPGGLFENVRLHILNLQASSYFYGLDGRDIAFNSSLPAGIKYLLLLGSPQPDLLTIALQSEAITRWMIPGLFFFIVAQILLFEMDRWKKAALITCGILLLSISSADYRLILLYIPLFLWLDSPPFSKADPIYGILFGLLLIPKAYFHLPAFPEISISTFLNPLLMAAMVILITIDNFQDFRKAEPIFIMPKKVWLSAVSVILVIPCLIIFTSIDQPDPRDNSQTIQQLRNYAVEAEYNSDSLTASSYYSQWLLRKPTQVEPNLGLARTNLQVGRVWESYQQYKKVLWLQDSNSTQKLEAERGIKAALESTLCKLNRAKYFKWAQLILQEYSSYFPRLSQPEKIVCG